MEKILLAIDAAEIDKKSLDFACYLARLTKSKITGVFLDNLLAGEIPFKLTQTVMAQAYDEIDAYSKARKLIEQNIEWFRQGCINREVTYSVHRDHGVPADEMIIESRFADVLVTDAETSFRKRFEGPPSAFVQDILKKAECPVIIAPASFEPVEEVIFAYNGTASAMFAIKQFTYLFPQLSTKKVSVIQVNETGKWEDSQKHKFIEWLKGHYSAIHFEALRGDSDNALFDYLFKRKNMFLVMGAYGRTSLSQFFKRSAADLLLKTITQPIFIAHH